MSEAEREAIRRAVDAAKRADAESLSDGEEDDASSSAMGYSHYGK